LFLFDAESKILPKIICTKRDSLFSRGIARRTLRVDLTISGSELDVDFQKDGVSPSTVVELRLLRTVDASGYWETSTTCASGVSRRISEM